MSKKHKNKFFPSLDIAPLFVEYIITRLNFTLDLIERDKLTFSGYLDNVKHELFINDKTAILWRNWPKEQDAFYNWSAVKYLASFLGYNKH
jgi:hypothetical protein